MENQKRDKERSKETERVVDFINSLIMEGKKLKEISEKLKISQQVLNKLVNEGREIKPNELKLLREEFDLNLDYVFGYSEEKTAKRDSIRIDKKEFVIGSPIKITIEYIS